jgi:hypothetical protein
MSAQSVLLAYFSPETVVPLTSILAAILGAAMFSTQRSIRFLVRCFRGALRRPQRIAKTSAPHFEPNRAVVAEEPRE